MALHPWWFGGGLLLGASLLVGSSVAVDRPGTPARLPREVREAVVVPAPQPSARVVANRRPASAARSTRSQSSGQAWLERGGWEAIEDQIHKPVERPAKQFADSESVRFPSPAGSPSKPDQTTGAVETDSTPNEQPAPDADNADNKANETHLQEPTDSALTADLFALRTRIRSVLAHYQTRQLNTRDHNPWEMMHAFVAYNVKTEIRRDGPNGPPVNAIGWILWGGRCRGQQMLTLSRGRPHAAEGVGVQGHPAQLLAILAQSRVSAQTPMRIDGKEFTLQDLIDEEMLDCRPESEHTFKLISFAHYLKSDATWRSRDGQAWSIPRLINAEIKAPIRGAPCGGTHRLFGITYAYQMREREGHPLDGEFLRAKQYITSYQHYAWSLQNPDGSFSTEWFARRGNRSDIDRKIQTSGHILEWLVFSLTDEQLREPRTLKSVDFLATSLAAEPNRAWSVGPLGHALHALVMYNERVFGGEDESPEANSLTRRLSIDPNSAGDERESDAPNVEPADKTAALIAPEGPLFPGLD